MNTPEIVDNEQLIRRRKGQTLAEFAITLPILLILVFGVIEFGRVFQAWVTLQNSARTAARYASTGAYYTDRFPLDTRGVEDPNSIVPCMYNTSGGDGRGTLNNTYYPNAAIETDRMEIYEGGNGPGDESLFATWWSGTNCDPTIPEHQDLRKDIARLLSIMDQAFIGASGLSLPDNPVSHVVDTRTAKQVLYDVWKRPLPGSGVFLHRQDSDKPSWFDVMICSSRAMLNDESEGQYSPDFVRRYVTVLDASDPPTSQLAPVCLLNEIPPAEAGGTNNPAKPWLDPGNAGDTVTVVVSFNHPLITPLGLAPFIPLQARRSAVNESFRVARASDALLGASPEGPRRNRPPRAIAKVFGHGDNETVTFPSDGVNPANVQLDGSDSRDTDGGTIVSYEWFLGGALMLTGAQPVTALAPGTYTFTLRVTDNEGAVGEDTITVIVTAPNSPTPSRTPIPPTSTSTPTPPFSCDLITAGDLSFFGNRVFIQFQNDNVQDTVMTRADLHWHSTPSYPNLSVVAFALDGIIHWSGSDPPPNTDTGSNAPTPPDVFLNADRTVPALSTITWESVFSNPSNITLSSVYTIYDFAGTTFYFSNPTGGPPNPCVIPLNLPTPTPSPTFDPVRPTNTATWTPDCASSQVSVRFARWDSFGVVVLEVVNRRNTTAIMTDFQIQWRQRAPGVMTLERVTVGGSGPADSITPTVQVWNSGSVSEDANPPTTGGSTAVSATGREGNWLTNYTFPPNSVTPMYVDFGGTTTALTTAFGVVPSDFNGTWFEIGCSASGGGGSGGGGGGGGGSGRINLFNENTPVPTNTRGPTVPPPPTFTPSRTFTPGPPTNTPTRRPPTNTPAATNTPQPPPPPTAFPSSTPRDQGPPDG